MIRVLHHPGAGVCFREMIINPEIDAFGPATPWSLSNSHLRSSVFICGSIFFTL
jgi:hypothetical protein